MLSGYIIIFCAIIILLPWGDDYPSIAIPTIEPGHRNTTTSSHYNITTTTSRANFTTEDQPRGCPLDYKWCYYTPIVQIWQFLLGFGLIGIFLILGNYSYKINTKILIFF
jgi:hypothetical protein